ncbi:putative exocyst complex component Exo70, cullin repeat-like-containing domain superfamily [Helianthus annuus]|nr:putative exocyst complex component Exo70, cullin repeat-like-containing domain superfamily [Helianthus annuus]
MRGLIFTSSKPPSPSNSFAQTSSMSTHSHHQTFSVSIMEEDLLHAEQIIKRWDLDSPFYTKLDYLFTGDQQEARQFIISVNNLQSAMHFFISENANSEKIIHAQKLMQVAMKRLQKEFYHILSAHRDVLNYVSASVLFSKTRSSDSVSDEDNPSHEYDQITTAMKDLKTIADCMISSGYGKECVNIYKILRKSVVDETMYNLRIEKYSFNQINKMNWNVLELKIKSWLNAVKFAVNSLFSRERMLSDYVFTSSEKIRESCFSEICTERALVLFEFPELVAKSKKSMERMFKTLDLYSAVSDLFPDIETIFEFESVAVVRTQAVTSVVKLGNAVRAMLADFEASIQKETLKTPVTGAGIHPITRYVMNYLLVLIDYTDELSDIVADYPLQLQIQSPLPESYFSNKFSDVTSSVSDRFTWLVLVLLCKIDSNADLYTDVAQSYIFLLNNLNYVVSKVRNSGLRNIIGDDWIDKHEQKLKQYIKNYERIAWSRVTSSLQMNGKQTESNISVRDCFRQFNLEFNEAYRKQSVYVVSDARMREVIRMSLEEKILPVYRSLYVKYRGEFKGVDSVVKYAPVDLENCLKDLFQGDGGQGKSNTDVCP